MPPANARILAGGIPGAELVELAGFGHAIPDQDPEVVVELVRRIAGEARAPDA
jgi:pimeloyl-ACP methyl ester carboxylesterase